VRSARCAPPSGSLP
jgi:ribosome-associated protein